MLNDVSHLHCLVTHRIQIQTAQKKNEYERVESRATTRKHMKKHAMKYFSMLSTGETTCDILKPIPNDRSIDRPSYSNQTFWIKISYTNCLVVVPPTANKILCGPLVCLPHRLHFFIFSIHLLLHLVLVK